MKPLDIYLVRHGETEFNLIERVQGHNDSPLTELGIRQATCTGIGLADVQFADAYCGDTGRQIDTARYIMQQNRHTPHMQIKQEYDFREMCYGIYEGMTYYQMLKPLCDKLNIEYRGYEALYEIMSPGEVNEMVGNSHPSLEGGEKTAQRMKRGLMRIVRENPQGGNVLVATSSACLGFLLERMFEGLKLENLVRNASVTIIRYQDGKFTLQDLDDISFRQKGEEVLRQKKSQ